ncbi:MAG: glycoside hydrolase family 97 protein [Bacteroides sp.]|nr:glycoside hydrolase family 97 protein [Bacteroides sp.]
MNLRNYLLIPALGLIAAANATEIGSPSGNIIVTTSEGPGGTILYSVALNGKPVIEDTPLGLVTDFADLSKGMKEVGYEINKIQRNYNQDKIKKSNIEVNAIEAVIQYEGEDGKKLDIEWHVADDGVAYRYNVPKQKGKASMVIKEEKSSFDFPEGTVTFLTSQSDPMIGWKRTKPSYEEYYVVDAPMNQKSQYGHGYTFPALFKTSDGVWVLVTETGVDGYYCGSRLSDYANGRYSIAFPMEGENNGNGSSTPAVAVPGSTPWRVMAIGETLAPIVETTLTWDLVEPKYELAKGKARTGKGTWSWILWQDGSINYDDQVKYIDFAAEMGYDNVLIDNWWNNNIGEEKMIQLINYAKSKGVHITLWYSSSGSWNDIVQGPVNRMDRPIERKKWMKWMHDNGVDAIKVDFFGGDKQETIRLYEDILSDAADYGIDVVFHGCTLPRGWERMYPNFVGAEAVLASENLIFEQSFCDKEALHATLHPYIRNAAAIMEYGGSPLNKRMSRDNKNGNIRRTSDAFELATSVLFQNPVQYFALGPNNLTDAPAVAIDFLKNVPTTWDDTKYIAGYPGKYVVIARRHGDTWYVAGVSNLDKSEKLELDLSMFEKGSKLKMINDDKKGEPVMTDIVVKNPEKVTVTLNPASGFVIMN